MTTPNPNRGRRLYQIQLTIMRMRDECLLLYQIRNKLEQERLESVPVSKTLVMVENAIKSREMAYGDLEREARALVELGIRKVKGGK